MFKRITKLDHILKNRSFVFLIKGKAIFIIKSSNTYNTGKNFGRIFSNFRQISDKHSWRFSGEALLR